MHSTDWFIVFLVFLGVYELEGIKDNLRDIKRRLDK